MNVFIALKGTHSLFLFPHEHQTCLKVWSILVCVCVLLNDIMTYLKKIGASKLGGGGGGGGYQACTVRSWRKGFCNDIW